MASTAPLDVVYASCGVAAPRWATNEATLMIEPPPQSSMAGMPALQHSQTPLTLTSIVVSHVASGVVSGAVVVGRG